MRLARAILTWLTSMQDVSSQEAKGLAERQELPESGRKIAFFFSLAADFAAQRGTAGGPILP